MTTIKIENLNHIHQAARQFIDQIDQRRVFAFYGKMGAGKTTFVKAVCEELGVEDVITSPTFAIAHEYREGRVPLFHFDMYRLSDPEELFDLGW